MCDPHTNGEVEELRSLFVSVTGGESVTEHQRPDSSDREVDENDEIDVDDGLEDALAGAEQCWESDPAI